MGLKLAEAAPRLLQCRKQPSQIKHDSLVWLRFAFKPQRRPVRSLQCREQQQKSDSPKVRCCDLLSNRNDVPLVHCNAENNRFYCC
jgi:hypothetical protein